MAMKIEKRIGNRSELESEFQNILSRASEGSRIRSDKLLNEIIRILDVDGYPGLSSDLRTILLHQGFDQIVPLIPE